MPALHEVQSSIARALRLGPEHVSAEMFLGAPDRVLLGLKVHANTISHARLVALEESFPMTREAMGCDAFNALSRDFVEAGGGKGENLGTIGRNFPDWMIRSGLDPALVGLTRFEWAWLDAFHAADADALALADLAGLEEADVLALPVARHPSARIVQASPALCERLGIAEASHILVCRPQRDVLIHPASAALADLAMLLALPTRLNDLLAKLMALHPQIFQAALLKTAFDAGLLCSPEVLPS